ncbi:MAG TPA: hypothetical protein VK771_00035, partial [Acidimicrobiia bacterium]|nr:hypothetical protein [Acidimicrobiia bacterium]
DAGTLRGSPKHAAPIVGIAAKPGGQGYLLASADGEVLPFGAARSHGSMRGRRLNHPVVGIAYTPSGNGYFLVASDGGVFTFGDARFHGSLGGRRLHALIVGIAVTPTGSGYWLVAADGGVFTFGDAPFRGSLGAKHLNAPVVGMAATHTGHGYWLAGSDGAVYHFGDAPFFGSAKGVIGGPAVSISASPTGAGYLVTSRFGFSAAFGDAPNCSNFPFFPGPIGPGPILKGVPGFAFPGPGTFDTVGIAIPYDPSALHSFLAGSCGGPSRAFHATAPWHIDFTAPANTGFQSYCNVILERAGATSTGQNSTLDNTQGEAPGRLEIRSAQMVGNTTFRILSEYSCLAIARSGTGGTQSLPFTTTTGGDSLPFTSASPITIESSNFRPCQVEVFADADGHFVDGHYGSHAHIVVAAGTYFIQSDLECHVTVS